MTRCSQQHARYCEALRECGLTITTLDADLDHPDSTFVEDTAVLTAHSAVLTRPGARSREGEVAAMRPTLRSFFPVIREIEAPGTLDGGDICEAGKSFLPWCFRSEPMRRARASWRPIWLQRAAPRR